MNTLKTIMWLVIAAVPNLASATLMYDSWISNDGDSANYIITVACQQIAWILIHPPEIPGW